MRTLRIIGGAILVVVALHSSLSAQDPAKYFEDNCGMCHAIGGPPGGAPDLKGVTARRDRQWLVRFILNPEETAKHDPDAAALVKRYDGMVMPTTDGATPAGVDALLTYIEHASAGAAAPVAAPPAERTVTPDDVARGRDWYVGRTAFAHRAPACVSCHHVDAIGGAGGTLGPDLTLVHRHLGGANGVATWLHSPPTRVMRAVFRNQPLADDEAFAVAAMLAESSTAQTPTPSRTRLFVGSAALVAIVALALMSLLWSRRLTSVRRALVTAAHAGNEP